MSHHKPELDLSFDSRSFRSGSSHLRRLSQQREDGVSQAEGRYLTTVQVCCTTYSTGAAGEDDL